jgi:hypothetical protein
MAKVAIAAAVSWAIQKNKFDMVAKQSMISYNLR